jgi:hypothetical protein
MGRMEHYGKGSLEYWPDHWPRRENRVTQHDVTLKQYKQLRELVARKAGEREIEQFLGSNCEVLALAIWMFSTGHHMSWIFPKQQIPPLAGAGSGLIPDYLMAGAYSGGVDWFVLELKGADRKAFNISGKQQPSLSGDANKGICQLLHYIDAASRDQAYLRDGLELVGFREPRGILLIGTDEEANNDRVRNFKGAWNRLNPKIQIRSYSNLLHHVEGKLRDFNRV